MEICLKYPVQLASGKALNKMVLRRAKVADLREASRGSDKQEDQEVALLANDNLRIIQRAVPATRGVSLRGPMIVLALLLATLAGVGVGLARMLMRPGLPTAQVASRTLDLPILGSAAIKPR